MALQPPLKELSIGLAEDGFYKGFNNIVAVASKILIALIVIWCFMVPESAAKLLGELKNSQQRLINMCHHRESCS